MSDKWNLIIDVSRCNGCYNCVLAAKDEYVGNEQAGYFKSQPLHGQDWISIQEFEQGQTPVIDVSFVPRTCNHCDDAPCMRAAKNNAVRKRSDGIVIIDPEKSKGQKEIADACPYGAVFWNEELQIPQHWPFDAHLLDRGWKRPRCVDVCATGAIKAVKISDARMKDMAATEGLNTLRPELGTSPRVYYKSHPDFKGLFVAGSAVRQVQGVRDCASGASVSLSRAGETLATTVADDFGEFRFQGVAAGSGMHTLIVELDGLVARADFSVAEQSLFIGPLELARSEAAV